MAKFEPFSEGILSVVNKLGFKVVWYLLPIESDELTPIYDQLIDEFWPPIIVEGTSLIRETGVATPVQSSVD